LATPRPPKDEPSPPNHLAVGGGGSAPSEIYSRLGGIERSITYLEGHAQDARDKLDAINNEIVAAKASFTVIKWVVGIVGSILVLLAGFITAIAVQAAKHYLGW
jgi:hypothetical protein